MLKQYKIILTVGALIIITVIIFGITKTPQTPQAQQTKSLTLQTTLAPWPAEIEHLRERLTTINLPALTEEGTALHTHQHLDIFVHGKQIAVPAGIGINESGFAGFISPIHTHDDTGIIHIESPTIQKFTLGQFFNIWGVRFDQSSIGGYVHDASSTLQVYVNGKKTTGNPRDVELDAHEEIAITFGTSAEQGIIQASYSFPKGL